MRKQWFKCLIGMLCALLCFTAAGDTARAAENKTIYNSNYVKFSPDGQAWTTNAGETDFIWYPVGTSVLTGQESSLRNLNVGEHYYKVSRTGTIPIGKWEVVFRTGTCIHHDYPASGEDWHGIDYRRGICRGYYYSGWNPYCADCGETITSNLIYMSRDAAASIDYFDLNKDYYYLCPWCDNLEQGSGFRHHKCNAISWNQYQVNYDANAGTELYGGYMTSSLHMYNNSTEYEGAAVTPNTHLNRNRFTRSGYEFMGWNTKPDGSGLNFADGAEIYNLTTKDIHADGVAAIITLYAQWRPSKSVLQLNPNGGSYAGETAVFSVEREYGNTYEIDQESIVPPDGYVVSFDTNGGNALENIICEQEFTEWSRENPFSGTLTEGTYTFNASDGNVDTLTALYSMKAIILPEPHKENHSFGGWFFDMAFQQPAGGPGDLLIPESDITLYAQWVDLKLYAEDNYTDNGGRGAVDLSWHQDDQKNKSYLVYQSRDQEEWFTISAADDIGTPVAVNENIAFTGKANTYTVPYTGIYNITAQGAQGGSYDSYHGGAGGSVTAKIWLEAGEVISYTVGGSNGYHGGGAGTMFAGGGGCTMLSTNRKGLVLVAGGGGGASPMGDGGVGGSSASLAAQKTYGEDGGAGGGGGYYGGSAGELVIHHHSENCYLSTDKDILLEYSSYLSTKEEWYDSHDDENERHITQYGSAENLIPTNGATTLNLEVMQNMRYGSGTHGNSPEDSYIAVFDQNGTILLKQYGGNSNAEFFAGNTEDFEFDEDGDYIGGVNKFFWGPVSQMTNPPYWYHVDIDNEVVESSNNYPFPATKTNIGQTAEWLGGTLFFRYGTLFYGNQGTFYVKDISLPEGTTGIYIVTSMDANDDVENKFYQAKLSGGKQLICGYTEGQIISSKPAYGGSNYVNTECVSYYSSDAGVNIGDGSIRIQSEKIGFLDGLHIGGVTAMDFAAPDIVDDIEQTVIGEKEVEIRWNPPKDRGTVYYHQAESYLQGSSTPLCRSNITKNTLTTGVKGFYILTDHNADTKTTEQNGIFQETPSLTKVVGEEISFLHIAAVDFAGNVGETAHVCINPNLAVKWNIYTRQLEMENGGNVYPEGREHTYYVRSDGMTPFTIDYSAYMAGYPTLNYQINHAIFESKEEDRVAYNIVHCQNGIPPKGYQLAYTDLQLETEGATLLSNYTYTDAERSDGFYNLNVVQKFTLSREAHGKEIQLIPMAGADYEEEVVYSQYDLDRQNQLLIIGDGEAPVIRGLDIMQHLNLIDRTAGTISLTVTAEDDLSGVSDFYLVIENQDNATKATYYPDETGTIIVDITEDDPIFSGDFTVTAYATDHVGNENMQCYSTTEFALYADVERILEPHDPVFQCGESGILTIRTYGYADYVEVEFPEALTDKNPELNKVYVYTDIPQYYQEEMLQFMIPLYAPQNEHYEITVRAYKGDRMLEEHPTISVIGVSGSVLDDIRTRLR